MRKSGFLSMRSLVVPLLLLSSSGLAADYTGPASDVRAGSTGPVADRETAVTGRLANGVQFAILPRRGSEPGIALLMRNEGGFIAERRPGERGLAHLIEHIVFHSPTVGLPDDLDHLKRVGIPLTLPAPNAGSTSWRETNYYLSTRTTAPADLDILLTLFKDAASGMTLRVDAVDMAREEVMREMADKRLGNQIYANYIRALALGSPNDVIDAQNSDDVPTASIDTIRRLYQRLYRPRNIMIVVVGNVKVDETRALIERRFGDWKDMQPPLRRTPIPMFRRDQIRPVSFSALPDGRRTTLIAVVMPTPVPASSRARQARSDIMDLLVTQAINNRLAARQPTARAGKTGMFIENDDQGHRQIMLWDNYDSGQWASAVSGLRRTTCDLAMSGFTVEEWVAAKKNLIADLISRAEAMPKMTNVDLAKDLSHALANNRLIIPPDELLRYARIWLPRVDARRGSLWWRKQWGSGVEHLRVEAPELAKVDDPLSAIRAAANGAVSPSACKVS